MKVTLPSVSAVFAKLDQCIEKVIDHRFPTLVGGFAMIIQLCLPALQNWLTPDQTALILAITTIGLIGFGADFLLLILPSWTHTIIFTGWLYYLTGEAFQIFANRCTLAMQELAFQAGNLPSCAMQAPIAI